MRRPEPAIVVVELTPQAAARLDELVKTGLFGFDREDAAERLICRAIIDVLPILAPARELADGKRRP
jgi:hypothetical protein